MQSPYPNLMSLQQWASLALIDPVALAGLCTQDGNCRNDCGRETFFEIQGQGNRLSRQEISLAISNAERMIASKIGTWVAPRPIVDEDHRYPDHTDGKRSVTTTMRQAKSTMITMDGKNYKSIRAKYNFIQQVGKYAATEVGETATIQMDTPFTGYFTATIDLGFEPTANDTWQVYFTDSERAGDPLERWQLTDLTYTVAGTTLTIKGYTHHLVKPSRRFGTKWECLSGASADFVSTLLVYRNTFDPNNHGTLQWGNQPCVGGMTCNDTVVKATCLERDDYEREPILRPKPLEYNADTGQWVQYDHSKAPQFVTINYVAGIPRDPLTGWVAQPLDMAVFYLSASLLLSDAPTCGCDNEDAHRRLEGYRLVESQFLRLIADDPSQSPYREEKILAGRKQLDSSWGGKYGAVRAASIIYDFLDSLLY